MLGGHNLLRKSLDLWLGRVWVRHLYRVMVVLVFIFVFDNTNIFGARTAMNNAVHDFLMWARFGRLGFMDPGRKPDASKDEVLAYLRGEDAAVLGSRPQGATVVLWTEQSMKFAKHRGYAVDSWPISYEAHAELLYEVAVNNPAAIFVDFIFTTKRESDPTFDALLDAIRFVHEKGIPLYFASDPTVADLPAFPAFTKAVEDTRIERETDWSGAEPYDPETLGFAPATVMSDSVVRAYCLSVRYENLAGAPDHEKTLYQQSGKCAETPENYSVSERSGAGYTVAPILYNFSGYRGERDFSGLSEPMFLYWDRGEHLVTRQEFGICEGDECDPCAGGGGRKTGLGDWLHAILFNASELRRRAAGPPILPAHYVLEHEAVCGEKAIPPLDLIEDRIVLIGSAQSSSGDARNTPNSTEVPGVMIHAAAVENIIKFNNHYVRDRLLFQGIKLTELTRYVVLLLVAVLYTFSIEYVIKGWPRTHARGSKLKEIGGVEALRRENDLSYAKKSGVVFGVSFVPVVFSLAILLHFRAPPGEWVYGWFALIAFSPPWVLASNGLILTAVHLWEWVQGKAENE